MRILIIGGSGYIGQHIVNELIDNNVEVVVMDRYFQSSSNNNFIIEGVINVKVDILDYETLYNSILKEHIKKRFDTVLYLAFEHAAGVNSKNEAKMIEKNVNGITNILEIMKALDIINIVFISSSAVYGNNKRTYCFENAKLNPANYIGISKLKSENIIKKYAQQNNFNYCIVRPFNVAGVDEKLHKNMTSMERGIIFHLINKNYENKEVFEIMGNDYVTKDGTPVRDYIHVLDVSNGLMLCLQHIYFTQKSLTVNLGSGIGYSVYELIDIVSKYKNINYKIVKRRIGDPCEIIASIDVAKQELKWKPKYTLEDIVKSEIRFLK